jgi:tetratricopeptide (TPR) repeat protein
MPAKAPDSKLLFYLIIAISIGVVYYFFGMDKKTVVKVTDKKTILNYTDDLKSKLNSKAEKENQKKLEKLYEMKNSPTTLRAQENFLKGMRDFHLGNYSRAQEFFQVVLNLQPAHELARRHLYLSIVRFDEVLKAKLMLGESYYQKHNFKMCQSMYEQVLNMLQGKSSDQNYQIASAMIDKCRLASEGVR